MLFLPNVFPFSYPELRLTISCGKEKETALPAEQTLQTKTQKTEVYVSRISDSRTCEIIVTRKANGSAACSYSIRHTQPGDVFRTYTPDNAIVRDAPNNAHIDIKSNEHFYYIPFENPHSTSIATGVIVFTCECCATGTSGAGGGCLLTGTIDPFSIDCQTSTCTGDCGLNAGGNLTNNTGVYIQATALEVQ